MSKFFQYLKDLPRSTFWAVLGVLFLLATNVVTAVQYQQHLESAHESVAGIVALPALTPQNRDEEVVLAHAYYARVLNLVDYETGIISRKVGEIQSISGLPAKVYVDLNTIRSANDNLVEKIDPKILFTINPLDTE